MRYTIPEFNVLSLYLTLNRAQGLTDVAAIYLEKIHPDDPLSAVLSSIGEELATAFSLFIEHEE